LLVPGEKLTAEKLLVIALKAAVEPSAPPAVLGVIESLGEVWFETAF
jgi:hypothetical protein